MPQDARSASPAACSLGPRDAGERRRRFDELCTEALVDCTVTRTGLRLRFRRRPQIEAQLRELARLEADCCAFARFEVTGVGDAVQLEVSAPADAVDTGRRLFSPPQEKTRGHEADALRSETSDSLDLDGGEDRE